MLNEIPVAFHSGSNFYYHFVIKKFEKGLEGECKCFAEYTESINFFRSNSERSYNNR